MTESPNALDLLLAAIRCDMAYMEPTWANRNAQVRVEVVNGIQRFVVAGTNDKVDVLNDVNIGWVVRGILGLVRNGFADAWDPVRDATLEEIGLDPTLPVVLEAHSLGVPISQYEAVHLSLLGFDVLGGIGFGGPTGFDKEGGVLPDCPWTHVKNGFDPVAGRPWLLWPGTAGGKWWQLDGAKIREGMRHPAAKPILFWRAADDHRLRGPRGYIKNLGDLAEAQGLVKDRRQIPEYRDWAVAVVEYVDRGEKPLIRMAA